MSSSEPPEGRGWIVAALLLAMFLSAMEATVIATAMPTVIAELGGLALYGWVGASYMLAATVTVPLYGKLADRSGRKRVLIAGILVFLVGSLLSGIATSIEQLIVFRAIQGAGAGAIQPIVLTVIGDLYTPSERGKIQGAFGAIWGFAGIAGPLVGGAIVELTSWRWVFLINLPFGFLALAVLAIAFREKPRARSKKPLDAVGAMLILLGSLALLLGASRVAPLVMIPIGVALIALFVWVESRVADPVLPIPLMTRRLIAVSTLASLLFGAVMSGSLNFLPLHVQGVLRESPTQAGMVIAPMLVGWPIASALTSRMLTLIGYRFPLWLGAGLTAASMLALVILVQLHLPSWTLFVVILVFGFGQGLANTSIIIGAQGSVGWEERGVVTSSIMFARNMGGALGVGALGALLAARLEDRVAPEIVNGLLDPHQRETLSADPATIEALAAALDPLFWGSAIAAAIAMATVLAQPADPPSERSSDPLPAK